MSNLPIDLKDYKEGSALTAVDYLYRIAGIAVFILFISLDLDKLIG